MSYKIIFSSQADVDLKELKKSEPKAFKKAVAYYNAHHDLVRLTNIATAFILARGRISNENIVRGFTLA